MVEMSLADHVPLWRSLREEEVTCLVTPALDYCGALELYTRDVRFADQAAIDEMGENLRKFVAGLDDGTVLHFLYCAEVSAAQEVIREYEQGCAAAGDSAALSAYVAGRAAWLRGRPLRTTRVYLFFCRPILRLGEVRGLLGSRLLFASTDKFTEAAHVARLHDLREMRDRIAARLESSGFSSRELPVEDVRRIHFQMLNPNRARTQPPPSCGLRDDIFDDATLRSLGPWAREYTEAEQLFNEDLQEEETYLRQGETYRRVSTLKILPEEFTDCYQTEGLVDNLSDPSGPFPYTLAVTVSVQRQGLTKFLLNQRHKLVSDLKGLVPWVRRQNAAQDQEERGHQASIEALFEELGEMSSKIVAVSVSLLLEAPSLAILERRTEAARAAFERSGNSQMLDETGTQIPAFLSVFPGAGPYQLRKKGCTSRNAADFLPVFSAWRGTRRAASILQTPGGDLFRFDPFDDKIVNANHAVVVAETGKGKSVSVGALVLDALGSGVEGVLIDNGASWAPLTQLLGGVHVPVDLRTSISPFTSYSEMLDPDTREVSNEELELAVQFLEVCVQDRNRPPFDKVEKDAVSKAIRWCYETRFRERSDERPLIGDFADAIKNFPWTHPDDKRIAEDICRRLEIFTTGIYRDFLNKPSTLKFDVPLLTFDMAKVAENPVTRAIAMATMINAISNRAKRRRRATIVAIDEAHEYLGADDATEQFLGRCYRKMRKFGTAMYSISQKINDFLASRIGRDAILGNCTIRYFLPHEQGNHAPIIDHFKLSPRAAAAFENLSIKPGYYSDLMLMYGPYTSVIRLALTPLSYWILTTDKRDKDLLQRAMDKNPRLGRLELLQELAARFPHGAVGAADDQIIPISPREVKRHVAKA